MSEAMHDDQVHNTKASHLGLGIDSPVSLPNPLTDVMLLVKK